MNTSIQPAALGVPEWLTLGSQECAELLRCTPEQVEELARAGEIPGLKFGRSWLFVRDDLLAYLAERAREEAAKRRSKRSVGSMAPEPAPSRRRSPPALPIVLGRP
jgi:excisionase family DNA binding protein